MRVERQAACQEVVCLKRFYPFVIVACCFLITFGNMGLPSTGFSVYQSYIVEVPGVGDLGGSLVVTLRVFVAFICSFLTNRYYAAIDVRRGVFIVSLFGVAGFIVYGLSDNLVGLCAGAVLTGIAYGFGGTVAVTLLIGNWFKGHLGTAIGWASVGSGIASFVMPVIIASVIHGFGLSEAFFVDAFFGLVLSLVVVIFVRSKPQALGLAPYEAKPRTRSTRKRRAEVEAMELDEGPLESPLPRMRYLAMIVALFMLGADAMVGMAFLGILMTSEGIDPIQSALLLSLAGICLTCSKLIIGVICDRFGTMLGSALFFIMLIVGLTLCCLIRVGGFGFAVMAVVLFGCGGCLGSTGISLWSLELSTSKDRLRTIRSFQTAFVFGGFAFNMLPGILKVSLGSYVSTYVFLALMAVASAVIVLSVYGLRRRERQAAKRVV